jgi:DNA processing protein
MSRGVLVIEADERSGALITARQAGDDHGRPVFALPGRVDNKLSAGPHELIRDGATLVTKLEHILEGLGPLPQDALEARLAVDEAVTTASNTAVPPPAPPTKEIDLSDVQRRILDQLDGEPISVDTIIERAGLDAPVVMRELTFLCLKGVVRRTSGQMFARGAR